MPSFAAQVNGTAQTHTAIALSTDNSSAGHCEGVFLPEAIPSLQVGIAFAPLMMTTLTAGGSCCILGVAPRDRRGTPWEVQG